MKIGILGGTFDPIHIGHMAIAEHACKELDLTKLLLVPAAIPPHKQSDKITPAEHRLEMTRLAAMESPKFEVSDIELRRKGVSYTIDTLGIIQAKVKVLSEYFFIIGSDMLPELHLWKNIDRLVDMCTFVVAVRPGFQKKDWKRIGIKLSEGTREKVLGNTLENPMVEVSSTDIRNRVRDGRSIHYMVPAAVEEYIQKHGLYRN